MSLADFMRQLQEQEDGGLVYSKPPEKPVKVIPPEKANVRLIPPTMEQTQPKVLKLKINRQAYTVPSPSPSNSQPVSQPQVQQQQPTQPLPVNNQASTLPYQPIVQPTVEQNQPKQQPTVAQSVDNSPEKIVEALFLASGTEISKKELWLDAYESARKSKKSNPLVDRVRMGKFMITQDNKIANLPDYDVMSKDPDDVIRDKWF